jgi:hypothetical protein
MSDRIPRRLRLAFSRPPAPESASAEIDSAVGRGEVDFVAYSEDCILSGRTVLDGDRLTDMLNEHDEYDLIGVTVERFDGGPPIEVAELVVPRDEVWLVHASGPRGNAERRHRTAQQHIAIKMGPYAVRGFYHALPGTDPVSAIRRRKPMVPLTGVRIEYTIAGDPREVRVDTVIANRDLMEWVEAIEPDRVEFPVRPKFPVRSKRMVSKRT